MANYKSVMLTERDKTTTPTSDVKKQLNKFDTTYTSKKLNELYHEFDSITTNTTTINTTIVKENAVEVAKPYAKLKTAVYLSATFIVIALLAFLAIYNIFVINGLNKDIQLLEGNVKIAEQQFETVQNNLDNLNSKEMQDLINQTFNGEFASMEDSVVANATTLQSKNTAKNTANTNWFDQFCTFFSNIFGG